MCFFIQKFFHCYTVELISGTGTGPQIKQTSKTEQNVNKSIGCTVAKTEREVSYWHFHKSTTQIHEVGVFVNKLKGNILEALDELYDSVGDQTGGDVQATGNH